MHRITLQGPGFPADGPVTYRRAVKAIALRARTGAAGVHILALATPRGYKLPGGGVRRGETPEGALRRELTEECGAPLLYFGAGVLTVVETRLDRCATGRVFQMTSVHHVCQVGDRNRPPELDDYESTLGLSQQWLSPAEAAAACAAGAPHESEPWLEREARVFDWVDSHVTELLAQITP